jgi:hypothetical protein
MGSHWQEKWQHYRKRYGALHAVASFIGRYSPSFWRIFGRWVTAAYKRQYFKNHELHERYLNLGSGGVLLTGWLNADINPRSDIYVDVNEPLPFNDNPICRGAQAGLHVNRVRSTTQFEVSPMTVMSI